MATKGERPESKPRMAQALLLILNYTREYKIGYIQ
jgi:hypothetical protein